MKAVVGVAGLVLGLSAVACEPGLTGAEARRIDGERYVLAWRARPAPIRVSEFFALDVAVCARDGAALPATLRLDAQMPEHRHGMNYRPTIERMGEGRFLASGLLFHMPGRWQFSFDVRDAQGRETLRSDLVLR
jgi:hypothetical protein